MGHITKGNAGPSGLFSLPNEILLDVLALFSTKKLLSLTTTCRRLHSLSLLVIHNRLKLAAGLGVHALYMKCHQPSAEWQAPKFPCTLIGTNGLEELLAAIYNEDEYLGQVKSVFGLYSRYRPSKEQPLVTVTYRPQTGSRIYTAVDTSLYDPDAPEPVQQTVTVEAGDSFTQLTTNVWLGRRDAKSGILVGMHEVSKGWIRVWRDWLAKLCESRRWTDGEAVIIYESSDGPDRAVKYDDHRKDPAMIWLAEGNSGVKFRVRQKNSPPNTDPFASDVDLPVTYVVELEELLVRTSHLLATIDAAERCLVSGSGKAIVFGSFRG